MVVAFVGFVGAYGQQVFGATHAYCAAAAVALFRFKRSVAQVLAACAAARPVLHLLQNLSVPPEPVRVTTGPWRVTH